MGPAIVSDRRCPRTRQSAGQDEGLIHLAFAHREAAVAGLIVVPALQEQRLQLDAQAEAIEYAAHASIAGDRARPIRRIGQEPRIDGAKKIDVRFEACRVANHMVQRERDRGAAPVEQAHPDLRTAIFIGALDEDRLEIRFGRRDDEGAGAAFGVEAHPARFRAIGIACPEDGNRLDRRDHRSSQNCAVWRGAGVEAQDAVELVVVEAIQVERPLQLVERLANEFHRAGYPRNSVQIGCKPQEGSERWPSTST